MILSRPYWKFHNWIWINAQCAAGAISEIIPLHLFKWRESVNTISMGPLNHQIAFMILVQSSSRICLWNEGVKSNKPLPPLKILEFWIGWKILPFFWKGSMSNDLLYLLYFSGFGTVDPRGPSPECLQIVRWYLNRDRL